MATSNLTNDIIATTDKGGRLNLTAHDRCAQRLTQARSIISLLEQTALRAAEDKDRLELSPAQLAETEGRPGIMKNSPKIAYSSELKSEF